MNCITSNAIFNSYKCLSALSKILGNHVQFTRINFLPLYLVITLLKKLLVYLTKTLQLNEKWPESAKQSTATITTPGQGG